MNVDLEHFSKIIKIWQQMMLNILLIENTANLMYIYCIYPIKAGLIYTQGLKYTPGIVAE